MNYQTGVTEKPMILNTLIDVAPIFQKLFPLDCTIAITDKEYFLADYPSKELQLNLEGTKIPEDTGIRKAMVSEETLITILPEEVYGVPFKSIALPIKNKIGQVVGCMALGMSLKNQERLKKATESLSVTSEEIVASTEELAASAQELANGMELVDLLRKEMEEQVLRTEELLDFIRSIAQNSNILGLNAAIEAARVGEKGQGFKIIAAEIRKMAEDSGKSVEKIKLIIEEIKQRTLRISREMQRAFQLSQNQASASQEIATAIQGLNEFIIELEDLSRII
ncbi:MAG: hypothetical protein GXW90_11535 [Tepidanaerobacter acetatoxydans]|uniref:methyl-accepting chemotaxis protein n=1 Tax=Tepidanaerobacter acetatoxydans TaxID=499229 RepID=UPI0026F24CEC|nr:methyl-accepting chemotaxis protein [Tepidanaerobacter acetatoxydans]NLU11531.1 hypothetical protein [Tepidanaerobacter acetatoxydans]